MDKAYRIPNVPGINESPMQLAPDTVPINQMLVRSLFLRPTPDEKLTFGSQVQVEGLAFDSGKGIRLVEVSPDAGTTWYPADLGKDLGRYSWRRWTYRWTPNNHGKRELMVRQATPPAKPSPPNSGTEAATRKRNRAAVSRSGMKMSADGGTDILVRRRIAEWRSSA